MTDRDSVARLHLSVGSHLAALNTIPVERLRFARVNRRLVRRGAIGLTALAVLALAGYGMVVLFMLGIEDKLVYDPSRPDQEWLDKPNSCIQDITLRTGDGALHAWYCDADHPDAVLLLCHGNAGNLSIRGNGMLEYRQRYNASVMVFDYPGYGLSDGRPSEEGCYAAAEAAYNWLVQVKGFKPKQVIIYGESLGGGVAVELARRKQIGALILVNTFANLPEVAQRLYQWLPVTWLMRNRFDSEAKISECRAPIFLTHGTTDRLIPPDHSQRLLNRIAAPREYLLREGKDHVDPLGPETLEQIRDFLVRYGCISPRRS